MWIKYWVYSIPGWSRNFQAITSLISRGYCDICSLKHGDCLYWAFTLPTAGTEVMREGRIENIPPLTPCGTMLIYLDGNGDTGWRGWCKSWLGKWWGGGRKVNIQNFWEWEWEEQLEWGWRWDNPRNELHGRWGEDSIGWAVIWMQRRSARAAEHAAIASQPSSAPGGNAGNG